MTVKTISYTLNKGITVQISGELIFEKQTKYQNMSIMDVNLFGRCLVLDNITQLAEKDEYLYHESIVHPAMLAHPNPKKILVIGGGDGGTLREVFRHPVEKVTFIELDPEVVDVCKKHLPSLSNGAFEDPRLEMKFEDGREFLQNSSEKWDVIILDLTDPTGPSRKLFTKEFYEIVKAHLNPGGIVALDADSPDFAATFPNIIKTLEAAFPNVHPFLVHIPFYFVRQGFAVCSMENLSKMKDPDFVQNQMNARGLKLKLFDAASMAGLFTRSYRMQSFIESNPWKISTDANPVETPTYNNI